MNNKILILLCIVFFAGCGNVDPDPEADGRKISERYSVWFVKFSNEAYKDYVIAGGSLPTYPKRIENGPYFISDKQKALLEQSYDICEIASQPVLLELHNGYYMFYPFTKLGSNSGKVINVKWSDICDADFSKARVVSDRAYSEAWVMQYAALKKLTRKSIDKMTITDIQAAINKVIDKGEIEKYCYGAAYPVVWSNY